jgi:SAM-dependent methyltransferase
MVKQVYGGYDPNRFQLLAGVEKRHFWFRARRALISRLTGYLTADLESGFRVLEFGCGTGNVLSALELGSRRGVVVGMDLFHEGLIFAKQRGHEHLVQADAGSPPFVEVFHLIGTFDVIEHLPNDVDALRQLFGLLKPGGHLLVTVPAYPWLWSEFDDLSRHCRRYTEGELRTKLAEVGFEIVHLSPYMAAILPLVWFHRKFLQTTKRSKKPDVEDLIEAEMHIIPIANEILAWLLWLESQFISRGGRLPFGTSLIAVARRGEKAIAQK